MTNREFFIQRWEAEQPAFTKVLRAMPADQLTYRPHEKCTAAGALAWQLVDEQNQLIELIETGAAHLKPTDAPAKASDIVDAFEKATKDLRTRLQSSTDYKWSSPANFFVNGQAVWSDTIGNLFWAYLFDMVHHRGQLSAYLRPMGGKVPSIYGPSADETGA